MLWTPLNYLHNIFEEFQSAKKIRNLNLPPLVIPCDQLEKNWPTQPAFYCSESAMETAE